MQLSNFSIASPGIYHATMNGKRENKRESVCVCVCERERERERKGGHSQRETEKRRESVGPG